MDSNECPQVTVIPAERGWELVIWQAGGDGEPDPHGAGSATGRCSRGAYSTTDMTMATSI